MRNTYIDRILELLVILGITLAPMTSLRIAKIGPAELICLAASILHASRMPELRIPRNLFAEFWELFMPLVGVGTVICIFFYRDESYPQQLFTWLYFAVISVYFYDYLHELPKQVLGRITKRIVFSACIWYLFLFIYHERVSDNFFGAQLMFGGVRYTGGGTNPHQVAILMSVVAVLSVGFLLESKTIRERFVYAICLVVALRLLNETESSTGKMAFIVGIAMIALFQIRNPKLRFVLLLTILCFAMIFYDKLFNEFMDWVRSDRNGAGRFEIWKTYLYTFDKSPFFGLGPGNHAFDGTMEYHNTYIEVLAMSGFFGALVFGAFSLILMSSTRRNPVSASVVFALYAFGFSGFGMRRLVFWTLIPWALAYAESKDSEGSASASGERLRGQIRIPLPTMMN